MKVLTGTRAELPQGVYSELGNYRRRVFIERLGWELQTQECGEVDQFDRPDTVYVVIQAEDGQLLGCARLLPTTRPYLLKDVFPQLLNGTDSPCSPEVWELSRFAAVDLNSPVVPLNGQFSSPVAVQLLRASIACGAALGARQLVTVSPLGVERLLQRAGFRARRAGAPRIVSGYPLFACLIETGVDANQEAA